MRLFLVRFTLLVFCVNVVSCSGDVNHQFELLGKDVTGLEFENVVKQSVDFNVFAYMYFFNGGGTGVGDFNNDGYEDLYFTSNMGPNKLFLNEGGLKFKDITEEAGVAGIEGWSSGVSVADVNADGLLDIYVNQIGDFGVIYGKNQLFICQGIEDGVPKYVDEANKYGLDLVGFSTQSSFFDYDLDGDLDMFQLNHSLHANGTFGKRGNFESTKNELSGDKLFRNDGEGFTDITAETGISSTVIGYGLGIATGDLNNDGWPDLYIGNDFHENDYLYLNNQDGTFREVLRDQIMHTSRFSMGVDIGDINNDAQSEIISVDMLPEDPYILKTSLGEDDYGTFQFKLGYGYNHQYARNNLQLNNGDGTFSEIGLLANIHATDWSWTPLFVDFDLDGFKDLFISNGIPRRMNDIDYLNFRLSDDDVRWKTNTNFVEEEDFEIIEKMPQIKLKNKFFKNNGNLTFENMADVVKNNRPTYSNGAAFGDFDNDGDMDIVVNNIYDEPFVYKNLELEGRSGEETSGDYLKIKAVGIGENTFAIGSKVIVFKAGEIILQDNFPVRGYQSSSTSKFLIGVGDADEVDSVFMVWPDRTYKRLEPKYNSEMIVKWEIGLDDFNFHLLHEKPNKLSDFVDITQDVELNHIHEENQFVEFNRERLIPHMVSSEGPALAIGDLNGDGLEDIFFGGAKRKRSAIFYQKSDGTFIENTPGIIINDSIYEDVDAEIIDIDNDADMDIVIASGGNEYWGESEYLKQRLYLNDGKGSYTFIDAFDGVYMTASCVLPGDFDGDGLVDIFFGGRAVPKAYGEAPPSYLFRNLGDGTFENVSESYDLINNAGFVKDGQWFDIDADGKLDLILATEWAPVQIFRNKGESFEKLELNGLKGWWNFVLPADFDNDGDIDILAGNTGRNSKLKPSMEEPVRLYVDDFDNNDQVEQILTYYLNGREIPFANYKELTSQLVSLKKKYLYSKDLAAASLEELFEGKLDQALIHEVNTFESMLFVNNGDLTFQAIPLPTELQISSLETAALFKRQGEKMQVLVGGNFYDNNIEMGRYDGDYGSLLSIGVDGAMEASPIGDLNIKGQVRRIAPVTIDSTQAYILGKNNDYLQVISPITRN